MRNLLKSILYICVFIAMSSTLSSCNGDDDSGMLYESTATLVGPDFAACPCCSGWILEIDNDSGRYLMVNIPDSLESFWDEDELPIRIKLNWTLNRVCTDVNFIEVDTFELE